MFEITPSDLHPHLQARMRQRGITLEEIEQTLNHGWEAPDGSLVRPRFSTEGRA